MLEQLPGAHQLKHYSFKYNPPFDNSSLEETQVNCAKYADRSTLLWARQLITLSRWNRYTEIILLLCLWRRNWMQWWHFKTKRYWHVGFFHCFANRLSFKPRLKVIAHACWLVKKFKKPTESKLWSLNVNSRFDQHLPYAPLSAFVEFVCYAYPLPVLTARWW